MLARKFVGHTKLANISRITSIGQRTYPKTLYNPSYLGFGSQKNLVFSGKIYRKFSKEYVVEDEPQEDNDDPDMWFNTRDRLKFDKKGVMLIADNNTEDGKKLEN